MQTAQATIPPVSHQDAPPETGQRVILRGVSWATYESLLADFQDSHAAHFAYDRGVLEIMAPSFEHEAYKDTITLLINIFAEEMEIDVSSFGSATFRREDLARGFEPDACFYIQNEVRVRGKKKLDLTVDPPPDLVIEIDITSPSLNKLPIYATVGVPEAWRYGGEGVAIYTLSTGGQYQRQDTSSVFPGLMASAVTQFTQESRGMKRTVWLRRVREWARRQAG